MQKRYLNYRDPVSSFEANAKYSGVISANVYCGFDKIINLSGLTFQLDHSKTGQLFTDINQAVSPRLGVWATQQGTIVKEDAPIPLTVLSNSGNSQKRIDLVIGRHYHDVLEQGGVNATYEVIKGPSESFTPPSIPEPENCTVLGRLIIPENTSAITQMVWVKNRVPGLGGQLPALLGDENRFTAQIQLAQNEVTLNVTSGNYEIADRGLILGLTGGNLFRAGGNANLDLMEDKPNGTEIKLVFQNDTLIRGLLGQITGNGTRAGYAQGLRPIVINDTLASLQVTKGQTVTFIKYTSGLAYVSGKIFGDYWKVLSVDDTPSRLLTIEAALKAANDTLTTFRQGFLALQGIVTQINPPRSLVWVDLAPTDYATHFDASGKALQTSPYWGYAECNGGNGTTDFGNTMLMGRQKTTGSSYGTLQKTGGANSFILTKEQLPKIQLEIPYVWNAQRGNSDSNNIGTISSLSPEGPQTAYNKTGKTGVMGSAAEISLLPPYRITLLLMWIGIPYEFPVS